MLEGILLILLAYPVQVFHRVVQYCVCMHSYIARGKAFWVLLWFCFGCEHVMNFLLRDQRALVHLEQIGIRQKTTKRKEKKRKYQATILLRV